MDRFEFEDILDFVDRKLLSELEEKWFELRMKSQLCISSLFVVFGRSDKWRDKKTFISFFVDANWDIDDFFD